jgi:hypothetical protein
MFHVTGVGDFKQLKILTTLICIAAFVFLNCIWIFHLPKTIGVIYVIIATSFIYIAAILLACIAVKNKIDEADQLEMKGV